MRTVMCQLKLPDKEPVDSVRRLLESAQAGRAVMQGKNPTFQTPDLEDWPEGGYEISRKGKLSFVSPTSRGVELPDTQICGKVRFSGRLRIETKPPSKVRRYSLELQDGQVVAGPTHLPD